MTVARMEAEMSNAEFEHWKVFYGRRRQRQELEAAKAQAKAKGGR